MSQLVVSRMLLQDGYFSEQLTDGLINIQSSNNDRYSPNIANSCFFSLKTARYLSVAVFSSYHTRPTVRVVNQGFNFESCVIHLTILGRFSSSLLRLCVYAVYTKVV